MNILFIDTDRDLLESMKYTLSRNGFNVTTSNPQEAYKKINQFNPSLVISDAILLKLHGYRFLQNIKEVHPYMKFLFIASHEYGEDLLRNAGVEFLRKPFNVNHLISTLKNLTRENDKREIKVA